MDYLNFRVIPYSHVDVKNNTVQRLPEREF